MEKKGLDKKDIVSLVMDMRSLSAQSSLDSFAAKKKGEKEGSV